jgi:sugar O-acyltransferase (sialic acid O-acetyltransferase NeuD family)
MIYILGASAMARETLNIYKELGRFKEIGGFIEENCKREGLNIHGKSVMEGSIIDTLPKDSIFIGAMGSPKRKRWIEEIERKGFNFDTVIHPSAIVGDFVNIGKGCIVCPGLILTCDIKIGRHSIINIGSTINHDCIIGDFTTIGPGVSIAGNVTIGDECWISIGVKIINEVSIGKGSFIGAGAVVTKDIPENFLAVGVPAKSIRKLTESDWERLI